MLTYISILAKILALMSVASVVYLIIEFKRNTGFTKYLTRQDIDELYRYEWTQDELESLNSIIIDRRKIIKLISIFLAAAILSFSIVLVINSAKRHDTSDVEQLLNAMYVTDVKDIGANIKELDGIVSRKVISKLNPDNIDNLQDRYLTVSNPANKIRIINSATSGNNKYIEYQIVNNGIIISNRRLNISYDNNKISKFEEYILVPIDYVEENIETPEVGEENDIEKERKDVLEENLGTKITNPNVEDNTPGNTEGSKVNNEEKVKQNIESGNKTTNKTNVIDGDNITADDLLN